jgi:predicted dehydrogenase
MTNRQVGIGLIGYSIGKVHTYSWLNLRQFYSDSLISSPKLVAVCGRNNEAVSSFAKHYGYSKIYNDWRELVNDPEIQILDNCAPPNMHLESCVSAAEKGKAVLCEKPLARTADEAYEMYHRTQKTGQVHMTAFNKRFFPATLYARELVQSGRLGKITHVVGTFYNIEFGEGFSNPNIPFSWLFRRELAGHGAMNDLGSHLVDLMRFVIGEIMSVCGATCCVARFECVV